MILLPMGQACCARKHWYRLGRLFASMCVISLAVYVPWGRQQQCKQLIEVAQFLVHKSIVAHMHFAEHIL